MLKHLEISNYALISSLSIDFEAGYSVITGETGAGKSIIIGALGLLCGERADIKAVKAGESKCVVEAEFTLEADMEELFQEYDIDYDPSACIIRREVSATGKSRAFINDTPTTLPALKAVSSRLIDIHSQHRNLLLGQENFLHDTLDTMSADSGLVETYRNTFTDWKRSDKELKALKEMSQRSSEEEDYMRFLHEELSQAGLAEGELEELEEEEKALEHAEEIKQALLSSHTLISGDDDVSLLQNLRNSTNMLRSIEEVFPKAAELAERIESARIELADIADEAEHLADGIEFNASRLASVDERLSLIYGLLKKHKAEDVGALISLRDELGEKLNRAENLDDELREKENETAKLLRLRNKAAEALTKSRRAAAETLKEGLSTILASLGMPNSSIVFDISPRTESDINGADSVTLLFSANKNVPAVDVASVASGGEIARLMLALKNILSQRRSLPTIIFDEIDTGVSGTMAEKMAQVMRAMSRTTQVLCITHLPQIAALGEAHYRVFKEESDETVTTRIVRLDDEARVHEIANMLSGEKMTQEAIDNAKSLLNFNK